MEFLALGGATSPRRAPMTKKTTWYRKQTVSSVTTIWLKITMGVLVCKRRACRLPGTRYVNNRISYRRLTEFKKPPNTG